MKKLVLTIAAVCAVLAANAQDCSDLFISEYVQGSYNNRAIEIYNPTPNPINLGGYSVGRFNNGAATLSSVTIINLPTQTIAPYATFVLCTDKGGVAPTDTAKGVTGTASENPLYNGYQKMAVSADVLTGIPYMGANNDTLYHALTYDATAATNKNKFQWESTYKPKFDLRSHCDLFVCPVYNTNKTFYHNGNDAMALLKGTAVNSPVIDAVGIVGDATMATATYWADPNATGYNAILTRDRTLARKPSIKKGLVLDYAAGNTDFNVADWTLYSNDYFMGLGQHTCDCFVATLNTRQTANFEYFPNPIRKGVLTLKASEGMNTATLYNILGQAVRTEKLNGDVSNQIDLSGLNGGMFTLTVTFANGQESTQKVIIE
ncbi:MAG: hypothetical protein RI894_77 [Bacteroidota bacterium]